MVKKETKPQIDIFKQIPVIRSEVELKEIDASLTSASFSCAPQSFCKKIINIPTCNVEIDPNYEKEIAEDYDIPTTYIRYSKRIGEEFDTTTDYNLEYDDQVWFNSTFADMLKKAQQTGLQKSADANDSSADGSKPPVSLSEDVFEMILNLLERYTGYAREPLPLAQAEKIVCDKLRWTPSYTHSIVSEVYTYWQKKRESIQKPLNRKFWPQTASNDTNPHLVFRPRDKERYRLRRQHRKNDIESFRRMQHLRKEFSKTQTLLTMTLERENLREAEFDIEQEIFDQLIYDFRYKHQHSDLPSVDQKDYPRRKDTPYQYEVKHYPAVKKLENQVTDEYSLMYPSTSIHSFGVDEMEFFPAVPEEASMDISGDLLGTAMDVKIRSTSADSMFAKKGASMESDELDKKRKSGIMGGEPKPKKKKETKAGPSGLPDASTLAVATNVLSTSAAEYYDDFAKGQGISFDVPNVTSLTTMITSSTTTTANGQTTTTTPTPAPINLSSYSIQRPCANTIMDVGSYYADMTNLVTGALGTVSGIPLDPSAVSSALTMGKLYQLSATQCPTFMQKLNCRDKHPTVGSYLDYLEDLELRPNEPLPTRFQSRARVGRAGRIVIDRIPLYDTPYYPNTVPNNTLGTSLFTSFSQGEYSRNNTVLQPTSLPIVNRFMSTSSLAHNLSNPHTDKSGVLAPYIPPNNSSNNKKSSACPVAPTCSYNGFDGVFHFVGSNSNSSLQHTSSTAVSGISAGGSGVSNSNSNSNSSNSSSSSNGAYVQPGQASCTIALHPNQHQVTHCLTGNSHTNGWGQQGRGLFNSIPVVLPVSMQLSSSEVSQKPLFGGADNESTVTAKPSTPSNVALYACAPPVWPPERGILPLSFLSREKDILECSDSEDEKVEVCNKQKFHYSGYAESDSAVTVKNTQQEALQTKYLLQV